MEFFDRPLPPPMHALNIRALYEQNPTSEARTMVWEIWRLQRVIVSLDAGLAHASRLLNRQDIIDCVAELHKRLASEPCLNEVHPVKPGARRGGRS